MAAISAVVAAVGIAASAAGTVVQMQAQKKQAKAQEKAEKLREKQMNLEAQRQRREIMRKQAVARATALSNAVSQGAQFGSGLQGGFAQIEGEATRADNAVRENQQIGAGIFDANAAYAAAGSQAAFGSGLSSFGGALVKNSGTIGQIGTFATRGAA